MNGYIVFFDSGIGGVSVLREALRLFPYENFIYLADNLNVPYGKKSAKDIISFICNALKHLKNYEIKCLVLACNTATAAAVNTLREKLGYKVIGIEPNISETYLGYKKTLLIATSQTIALRQEKYNRKRIECLACDELVLDIENEDFSHVHKKIVEIINYCNINSIENLVLGCTHFVIVKKFFTNQYNVNIIDGNYPTMLNMGRLLGLNNACNKESLKQLNQINLNNIEIILTKYDEKKYNLIKKIASNGIIFQNPLETP